VIEVDLAFDFGVQRPEMREPLFADVAHHFQAAILERPEIAHEVRAPVSTSDNSDFDLL
jgi:hypothetical protein